MTIHLFLSPKLPEAAEHTVTKLKSLLPGPATDSALHPWLAGAFSSPLVHPHRGLCKTPPTYTSFPGCTALQRVPPAGNPQGKKTLLGSHTKLIYWQKLKKESPRTELAAWLWGGCSKYQQGRLESIILQNQEWHLVARDMKQVRAFTLQGRGWEVPNRKIHQWIIKAPREQEIQPWSPDLLSSMES